MSHPAATVCVAALPGIHWEVNHRAEEERKPDRKGEAQTTSVSHLRKADPRPRGMEHRTRRAPSLLEAPPRSDAEDELDRIDVVSRQPDLGDLVIVLLASTLAGLRDRLDEDGFETAAELVADLVEVADDYLTHIPA